MTGATILDFPAPRLEPPHRDRKSWGDSCRYCDALPGDPCRTKAGRPYVLPPDGEAMVTYTRASTLGKMVDDGTNLAKWKQRLTGMGFLERPDLLTLLAGELANGDPDLDRDVKNAIQRICDDALEAAKGSAKANTGTGLHKLTEAIDRTGTMPRNVPAADRARLEAYMAATADFQVVSSEGFVVCDDIRTAGSYDRMWLCPDGRVRCGDYKTGRWDADYPMGVTCQISQYVHGQHYDPETGTRTDLDPRLDLTTGLLIHAPQPAPGETPRCTVIPLDLTRGWLVALTASRVRDVRTWRREDYITTLEGANA